MEERIPSHDEGSEGTSGATEKWKLEYFSAKGWTPGKTSPKNAKAALIKRVKSRPTPPPDFAREATVALDRDLNNSLKGVVKTKAAKIVGDKDYKQYMETVEYNLAEAKKCLKQVQPLSTDALAGLQRARESLQAAKTHYESSKEEKGETITGRREKKITELEGCLNSLQQFEWIDQTRPTYLKVKTAELEKEAVTTLTLPGGPVDQVNTLLESLVKETPAQELTESSTLVVEALSGADEFTRGVMLSNLPGCGSDKPAQEVATNRAKHLAKALGNADPRSAKKFFASTEVPPGDLEGILGALTGTDAQPLGGKDGDKVREQLVVSWAEGCGGNKAYLQKTCQALLDSSYLPATDLGTKPLRGKEAAAQVLKGVAMAGGGEEIITSGIQKTLDACQTPLEINIHKHSQGQEGANKDIVAVVKIARQFMEGLGSMKLPEGLCVSSAQIYNTYVGEYGVAGARQLVGGHVILRIIAPMLAIKGGRSGIYVSKIVQQLANGVKFNDENMKPFNGLLDELQDVMDGFLDRIVAAANDPDLRG